MIGAKRQPGFTLIELLITAAIFSTASLLATTVFSNIQHTQRRAQSQQRVNADGRYILETIARSIRTGNINYAMFSNSAISSNPTNQISTIDQVGVITCYRLANAKVEVATNTSADCPANASWTAFTPDDLQVNTLNFFINPVSDPFRPLPRSNSDCAAGNYSPIGACTCTTSSDCFGGQGCTATSPTVNVCTNPNVQPHVTIFIKTTSKSTTAAEQTASTLQTTVVSRLYQ